MLANARPTTLTKCTGVSVRLRSTGRNASNERYMNLPYYCNVRSLHGAWRAGAVYIGLALLAEALLLMALVLLAAQIQGDSLLIRDAATALPASPQRDLILVFLIAGLGMKAGLVPFHFWMPLAYSAAPTPAAAPIAPKTAVG